MMKAQWRKQSSWISLIGTLIWLLLPRISCFPLQAAQTVVVSRDNFRQSITVEELKAIAQQGIVPTDLRDYAQTLTLLQKAKIRGALQTQLNIGTAELEELLATEIGTRFVTLLASVTSQTDAQDQAAVTQALLAATQAPEGLSIINFVEAYNQPSLDIDLEKSFQVLKSFNAAFWQTQVFMAEIAPQLPQDIPAIQLSFDPSQIGQQEVQNTDYEFYDQQRDRLIPVTLYYSTTTNYSTTTTANKPLIVFSHGLGSIRSELQYLAQHLASHGYVVAALEHPGSNFNHIKEALWQWFAEDKPPVQPEEFLHRPLDISFLLDKLATVSQSGDFLPGKLTTDNVLVVGYSLGGSTALTLAGAELQIDYLREFCPRITMAFSLGENAQCFARDLPEDRYQLTDERIKAAIALSPTTSLLFGEKGLANITIPTLIAASSADKTTPALTEQVVAFDRISQPKWLTAFVSGTHLSVKDPSTTTDQIANPDTLYSGGEVVGDEAVEVRDYVKAIVLAMAAQLTEEAAEYEVFLTPEYANFASTERIPIHLVTEIPPEAKAIMAEVLRY